MNPFNPDRKALLSLFVLVLFLLFLGSLSFYHFLLFHSLSEFLRVLVSFVIFVIAWNTRKIAGSDYLSFLGTALLFVGIFDLLHTIAYKGMTVFHTFDSDLPTQLWIAARYLESLSFLVAPLFFRKKLNIPLQFLTYLLIASAVLVTIFLWPVFPRCYIEGAGLTSFKVISEYIISLLFILAMVSLGRNREKVEHLTAAALFFAMGASVVAELFFTFYISVYSLSNLLGHLFKLVSIYFLYKALIEETLNDPFRSLFRELHRKERNMMQLIEYSPLPMVMADRQGNIITINRKFTEYFGYSREDASTVLEWWTLICPDRTYRENARSRMRGH